MSSDYEKWKKRRDAKQAQKREPNRESGSRAPDQSDSNRPIPPGPGELRDSGRKADPARGDYESWKRQRGAARRQGERDQTPYIGSSIDDAGDALPPDISEPSSSGCISRRGCGGCLLLFVGFLLVSGVLFSVANAVYWQQIEQVGATNVLVLGVDERSTEPGPFRSDTMILTNFDPQDREVTMLSIPRDLWLTIPGIGENRINTAHFFGGPSLAQQAVQQNLALPASPLYVKLNFNGFVDIIDAMGGITVNVAERLIDESYPTDDYGVRTVDIPAGEQLMDGETALIYARSRYSTSDFDRSRRQQEIIGAIKDKVIQPSIIFRVPAILNAIDEAITTDIPRRRWPALGMIVIRSDINRVNIGPDDTQNFITNQGAQVLLPIWENIDPILNANFR